MKKLQVFERSTQRLGAAGGRDQIETARRVTRRFLFDNRFPQIRRDYSFWSNFPLGRLKLL